MLFSEWIGFIAEIPSAKEACNIVVQKIQETKCKMLLNDNRLQTGPWPPLDDWLNNFWIPAMATAGLKYFAHIHSSSVFTKISATKILTETKAGIEFMHFQDERSAKDWLFLKSKRI